VYHGLTGMETEKLKHLYLILVPHRDTRLVLRKYSSALLKEGFTGAYSFPWVSPLAELSRPLNPQELKNIAHTFRRSAKDGKFFAEGAHTAPFPPEEKNSFLFGPRLDLSIPPDLLNGAGVPLPETVIGACLLQGGQNENALPCPPALSFSAAAVANMYWQSVDLPAKDGQGVCGYKWKIGRLFWLPNQKCTKPRHICD